MQEGAKAPLTQKANKKAHYKLGRIKLSGKFFGTRQIAELLGVTQPQIIKQINKGMLKATMVGNQYIVSEEQFAEYKATKRSVGRPRKV